MHWHVRSALGVAFAFLTTAVLGLALTREAGDVAAFWPANGVLVGALLRLPREGHCAAIVACFAANLIANLLFGDAPGIAVGFAVANMVEVIVAHRLITALAGSPFVLADLRRLFVLFAAGVAAPVISATFAAALLGIALGVAPLALWRDWWIADAVGMFLITPLVTSFDPAPVRRLVAGPRDRPLILGAIEFGAALALLGGVLGLIIEGAHYGSPVLFTPILLWIALRFGAAAVATAAVVILVAAATAAAHDAWPLPFTGDVSPATRVALLELLAVLVSVPPLIVAVLVRQRTRALLRLDDALESMTEGFALYDADGRLILHNGHYRTYLAPIADLLVPGARFDDLVREAVRRGIHVPDDGGDHETWAERLIATWKAGRVREVRSDDGRWLHLSFHPTSEGGSVVVCRDVTERKRLEQTLQHMAMHDPLTDLPNRKLYDRELRRARAQAERDGHRLAVMLLDLDRFKEVNDTYGHPVGDLLLVEVAHRLVACMRAGDVVARVGGDEFAAIAKTADDASVFAALAERILQRLGEPVRAAGIELVPHASLGFTVFPDDPADLDGLISHADRALYAAKEAGGRAWRAFTEQTGEDAREPAARAR